MFVHILLVMASLRSKSLCGGVHCVAEFAFCQCWEFSERGLRSYNVDLYLMGTAEGWMTMDVTLLIWR